MEMGIDVFFCSLSLIRCSPRIPMHELLDIIRLLLFVRLGSGILKNRQADRPANK